LKSVVRQMTIPHHKNLSDSRRGSTVTLTIRGNEFLMSISPLDGLLQAPCKCLKGLSKSPGRPPTGNCLQCPLEQATD